MKLLAFALPMMIACMTQAVKGAEVTFTITGTFSSGLDASGVFGFAPETSLIGKSFTLTYQFDDTKGQENVFFGRGANYGSSIMGTDADSPGTATLQIGSGSFTFGVLPDTLASSSVSSSATRYIVAGPSGSNSAEEAVSQSYTGRTGGATDYVDVLVAVQTNSEPPMTTDYDWRSGFTYTLTAADKASSSASFLVRDETNLPTYTEAYGQFDVDSITVSGPNAPAPEPATYALLGAGLTGMGILVRRQRIKANAAPSEQKIAAACEEV